MIYAKAMVLLAVLCAIGVAIYKYGTYRENLVRVEYQQRDLKAAQDYAAKEREVTEKYRLKEENWQQQFVAASRSYQKGLANAETARLIAINSAPILRDPYGTDCKAVGSATSETAANTGAVSQTGTKLSPEFDRFLKSEADRANKVVLSLNFCIGVLEAERQ